MDKDELQRIQELRYGAAAACDATLIEERTRDREEKTLDRKTLENWTERGAVLLSDDDRREAGERKRFTFPFDRIVQIALTAELVKLGVQPRRAGLAAAAFTDMSGGYTPGFPRRMPGQLFQGAHTFIVLPAGEEFAKVIPVGRLTTVINLMFPEQGRSFSTAIIIKVDDIYHRVAERLKRFEEEKRKGKSRELDHA